MGQKEKFNGNSFAIEAFTDPAGRNGDVMALEGPPPFSSLCQKFELARTETWSSREVIWIVGLQRSPGFLAPVKQTLPGGCRYSWLR